MRLLRNLGTTERLIARPALAATLAATFALGAVLFAVGWLPRAAPHEVSRGEGVLMSVACALIAGYFGWCARRGLSNRPRQRADSPRPR